MRLLGLLTLPYARKHKLRTALTLAGITLGVAVFVGMHTANRTVAGAFRATVDKLAGKAQLQVSAGETGFPEEALEKVQSLREVGAAAPVIEAVLNTGLPGQGNLLVLGVDMTGDRSLRDYDLEGGGSGSNEEVIEDPLIFLAQPDSLIVSERFAAANKIARNQKITLETMEGKRQFTVRGIMKSGGMAGAYGGNLAVMDIYAAQMVFGRGRAFDRIDIAPAEGVSVEQCQRAVAAVLGAGYQVEPPAARANHFDAISRGLSVSINISSMFALLVGVFIIYNSFAIATTERRAEIGILRALGASRRQVLGVFLAESLVAGVVGSALGVAMGLLIASAAAPALSRLVTDVFGTAQMADDLALDPSLGALAAGIGIVFSLAGGFLPARAAASVDPVKALQKGRYQVLTEGENRGRMLAALGLAAVSASSLLLGSSDAVFYGGFALAVGAALLLSPALAHWIARALRPLLQWIRPVEGALAADALLQAPRRTSATVSALMLSLSMAVGFSGVATALFGSVVSWMDGALNPDLFVAPTENITVRQYRFPATVRDELAAIEGVEEVHPVRNARVMVKGVPAMAVATDLDHIRRRVRLTPTEGNPAEMLAEAIAGRGVVLSENLANMRNLHKGDVLELDTPTGPLKLPVLGAFVDFSDQQGSFFIDRSLYLKYWRDDTVNIYRVYLRKGASAEDARRRIYDRLSSHRRLFVFTNASLRSYILTTTEQWFGMTYIQLAVALLVAILGIVNTLTVSITDRRRQLGVLQAVGGLRSQVRRTIWMEAAAIGLIGLLMGLGLGAVTLYYNVELVGRDIAGLKIGYVYPAGFALFLVPVILGAAWVASLWPAEAAVRASLVESLEYE